jgi:hypothetical protein
LSQLSVYAFNFFTNQTKELEITIIYSRVLNVLDGINQLESQQNPHKNGWLNGLARWLLPIFTAVITNMSIFNAVLSPFH